MPQHFLIDRKHWLVVVGDALFRTIRHTMSNLAPKSSFSEFTSGLDRDLLAEHLADTRSINTRRAYAWDLRDFFVTATNNDPTPELLAEFLGMPQDVAVAVVLKYKAKLISRGLKEATVNRRLCAVRSLVGYARKVGKCTWSLQDVQGEKVQVYRDTTGVGKEEWQKVIAVPDRSTLKGKRDYLILRLLWENVLRRDEMVKLNVSAAGRGSQPGAGAGQGEDAGDGRRHRRERQGEAGPAGVEEAHLEVHPHDPGEHAREADRHRGHRQHLHGVVGALGRAGGEQLERAQHHLPRRVRGVQRPLQAVVQGAEVAGRLRGRQDLEVRPGQGGEDLPVGRQQPAHLAHAAPQPRQLLQEAVVGPLAQGGLVQVLHRFLEVVQDGEVAGDVPVQQRRQEGRGVQPAQVGVPPQLGGEARQERQRLGVHRDHVVGPGEEVQLQGHEALPLRAHRRDVDLEVVPVVVQAGAPHGVEQGAQRGAVQAQPRPPPPAPPRPGPRRPPTAAAARSGPPPPRGSARPRGRCPRRRTGTPAPSRPRPPSRRPPGAGRPRSGARDRRARGGGARRSGRERSDGGGGAGGRRVGQARRRHRVGSLSGR